MSARCFCLLLCCLMLSGVGGLKITKLSIPETVDVRSIAVLSCDFDLENSKLYSVKWYKNDLEFCRFMPDSSPKMQIFKVEGIHLSPFQCNMTTVVLNPLDFTTSGLYSCEVSTEAPYFKTVQTSSNMSVMGIPRKDPIITGLEDVYAVGDYVNGNCTSDASFPPAEMSWFINDNKVESWQLEKYPPKISIDDLRLKSSVLGIYFQVDHSHFSGKGNTLALACSAKVGQTFKKASHISKLADLDIEKFAQGLFGNCGCRHFNNSSLLTVFLALLSTFQISK